METKRLLSDPTSAAGGRASNGGSKPLFANRRPLPVPPEWAPTLLVVIDTEEEFDWKAQPDSACRAVTNIQLVPRLQRIFDRYVVKPAYLVDHPVATVPEAAALLRAIAEADRCEIGAHLHPWVTPPHEEPLDHWHCFACNLPPELERRKIETLTAAVKSAFGMAPTIFKAGAYGIGPSTHGFLSQLGYEIDTSIVPFTSFTASGGPSFQDWTGHPFKSADGIVEIPLSAGFAGRLSSYGQSLFPMLDRPLGRALHLPGVAARLGLLERLRLSPEGHALADMIRLTNAALARQERLFMLTLHSSALLPGATAYVQTAADQAGFLARIDDYLRYFFTTVGGRSITLTAAAAELSQAGNKP